MTFTVIKDKRIIATVKTLSYAIVRIQSDAKTMAFVQEPESNVEGTTFQINVTSGGNKYRIVYDKSEHA